ncbi:hypothetical protein [Salinarimonas soli]|uniref:Uncharacterized protein n=1 Tax=Salinarimonas soli TaxID=1638099 RepID=A0A5B2VAC6_9HYPH|nr:hypothetical protein [Salinarimonas soli]KAA2235944.1 hypothetical protein F0L46_17420 [Salinarimonas soli]
MFQGPAGGSGRTASVYWALPPNLIGLHRISPYRPSFGILGAKHEEHMAHLDFAKLHLKSADDTNALKYLAGSLIAHWDTLPPELRASIYRLATSGKIMGLPATVDLKAEIDRVLSRNTSVSPYV